LLSDKENEMTKSSSEEIATLKKFLSDTHGDLVMLPRIHISKGNVFQSEKENEMTNSSSEDTATIKKLLSETYGDLVMAHNAAGYANLYSDDVLWSPPNGPDQTSKEGIKNGIQGLFDKFMFKVDPRPEEVQVQDDFAYAIGTVDGVLTPRDGGAPNAIKFRIVWLLRKEATGWKIFRQIWNNKPVED
jgi:uncharacterized protein (TIGR02246 family)